MKSCIWAYECTRVNYVRGGTSPYDNERPLRVPNVRQLFRSTLPFTRHASPFPRQAGGGTRGFGGLLFLVFLWDRGRRKEIVGAQFVSIVCRHLRTERSTGRTGLPSWGKQHTLLVRVGRYRRDGDILNMKILYHCGEHVLELDVQLEVYSFRVLWAEVGVLDRVVMSA